MAFNPMQVNTGGYQDPTRMAMAALSNIQSTHQLNQRLALAKQQQDIANAYKDAWLKMLILGLIQLLSRELML